MYNPPDVRCTSYSALNHIIIHVYNVYIKLNRVDYFYINVPYRAIPNKKKLGLGAIFGIVI